MSKQLDEAVTKLKADIFDIINHQNMLTAHHQNAEKKKQELSKKLQGLLKEQADSQPADKAPSKQK